MYTYTSHEPLPLESGGVLPELTLAYTDRGAPNLPVVWVCHALTANADPFDWWPGLCGPADLISPARFRIICANIPGSCYGSTGPLSLNPATGDPYYHDFPTMTVRDVVRALDRLRVHLGVHSIALLVGGSLGGQQAMEWAYLLGTRVKRLALIATNARHSAWGTAFNESQRMAIDADSTWNSRHPEAGANGMRAARAVALLSYRHYSTYAASQTDAEATLGPYRACSYQRYQGEKLANRFNAYSYYRLSQTMDTHHMGRRRPSIPHALHHIRAETSVIGIDTDVLFPPEEQRYLAEHIPQSSLHILHSAHGHDGFLIETEALSNLIEAFLDREVPDPFNRQRIKPEPSPEPHPEPPVFPPSPQRCAPPIRPERVRAGETPHRGCQGPQAL